MAICSPYGTPKFIERTEENDRGGILGKVLRQANENDGNIKPREGFDAKWMSDYQVLLRNTLPMDWEQLTEYYAKNGWVNIDRAASKKAGTDVFKLGKISAEESGMAAAVTKTYLDSVGGGLQQAADNFLMKVNAGEAATQEGLFLASQMQHASRFAGFALGWDQGYGRAVRAQGLRNAGPEVIRRNTQEIAESGATEGMTQAMGDAFQEIAKKMQDPAQYVDAINDLVTLAKRVKFADSPLKAFRISSSIELAGSAWNEVWVNGLLSSPATVATNALSVTWAVARPMAQFMTAKAYEMAGLPGKEFAQQAAAEAGATLSAMYTALNDGVKLGFSAWKTEQSIYAPLTGTTELAKGRAISGAAVSEFAAKRGWDQQADQYAEMFDTLGRIVRLPSRALLGSDEFVKHLVVRGEVAARGVEAAAKAGADLTDKAALKPFIDQEFGKAFRLDAPDLRDKYAVQRVYDYALAVRDEANVATFQEQNSFANWVTSINTKFPMLKPFIPFVRTPLNILKQGFYESTGLGAAIKAGQLTLANPTKAHFAILDELRRDPGESFRVAGQIAMTGALAAGVYAGVMSGQIIGGGPGRWSKGGKASDQQKAWERALSEQGRTPYSVMTPFGAMPFDRFGEPLAVVMRMVSDVAQYSGEISDAEKDEAMYTIAGIAVSGLYQASFLKGVDDLMGAMFGDTDTGVLKARAVQNYVSTQTPFGSLLNFLDKATDPYRKAYSGASFAEVMRVHEDALGTGILAKFADRIPGVNTAPNLIDQVTGLPVPVYPGVGTTGLNPFQMAIPFLPRGQKSADQTWTKIFQIMGSYSEAKPQGMRLTNAEQQALNKEMASIRLNGLTFAEWVNQFHGTPEVQSYIRNKNGALTELKDGVESEFSRMKSAYMNQALDNLSMRNTNLLQRRSFLETARQKARVNDMSYEQDLSALDALFDRARQGF